MRDDAKEKNKVYNCGHCNFNGDEESFKTSILSIMYRPKHENIQAFKQIKCLKCHNIVTIIFECLDANVGPPYLDLGGLGGDMDAENFDGEFKKSIPSLLLKLRNGEQISCNTCDCGSCKNEWFVRADSDDYIPNYCPYCGIKFIKGDQIERND